MVISKNKLIKFVSFLIIFAIIFACFSVAATFSFSFASAEETTYVDVSSEGTMLSSGGGLQFGANSVSTASQEGLTISGSSAYNYGEDMYIEKSDSFIMSADTLQFSNGTVATKIYLDELLADDEEDSDSRTDAVGQAMLDSDMNVSFSLSFDVYNYGSETTTLSVEVIWSNESSETDSTYKNNATVVNETINKQGSNSYVGLSIANISAYDDGDDGENYFEIRITSTNSIVQVSNVSVDMSVELVGVNLSQSTVSCTVSGDDRDEDTLDLSYTTQYNALITSLYVKPGDTIKMSGYATLDAFSYAFPDYFDAVFNTDWIGISWTNYSSLINGADGQSYLTCVEQSLKGEESTAYVKDNEGNNLVYVYDGEDGAATTYSFVSSGSSYTDYSGNEYEYTVDTSSSKTVIIYTRKGTCEKTITTTNAETEVTTTEKTTYNCTYTYTSDGNAYVTYIDDDGEQVEEDVTNIYSQISSSSVSKFYVYDENTETRAEDPTYMIQVTSGTYKYYKYEYETISTDVWEEQDDGTFEKTGTTEERVLVGTLLDEKIAYEAVTEVDSITYVYYATFTVLSTAFNATTIYITPEVYTGYSASGTISQQINTTIALKVDYTAASAAKLDTDSGLGAYIEDGLWYTSTNDVSLSAGDITSITDYSNYSYSAVNLYAFVLPAGASYDYFNTKLDDYDFSTDTTLKYTVLGSDVTAAMQSIISWDFNYTTNKWVRTVGTCSFSVGESSLLLVAVDTAGNVSTQYLYSSAENDQGVYVDATKYSVSLLYYNGSETVSGTNKDYKTYTTRFYVFSGSTYHTYNASTGTYAFNLSPAQVAASSGLTTTYSTAKRGEYVTVAVLMDATQASDYYLKNYVNQNGSAVTSWTMYTDVEDGITQGYVLYVFTMFEMGSSSASSSDSVTAATIKLNFREIVDISVNNLSSVYFTGTEYGFSLSDIKTKFNGTTISDNDLTSYKITYYEIIDIVVSNRTDAAANVTIGNTTYSTISDVFYLYNNNYYLSDSFVIGDSTYVVASYTTNTAGEYIIQAYILGENYANSAGTSQGFTAAGTYIYRIEMAENHSEYYGVTSGVFTIQTATPTIVGLSSSSIVYGTSLASVTFTSTDTSGSVITSSISYDDDLYFPTYYGVYGKYVITSPATSDANYTLPDVNSALAVTVTFYPIDVSAASVDDIANNWSFFSNYFDYSDEGGYTLKASAPEASNYNSVSFETTVVITHQTITDATLYGSTDVSGSETISGIEYDGNEKGVSVVTGIEDATFIIEYSSDGSTWSTSAPTNAGTYQVRYIPDVEKGNYCFNNSTTAYQYAVMIIDKRDVTIVTNSSSTTTMASTLYDGTYYTEKYVYVYGYIYIPSLTATYLSATGETEQLYPTYVYESLMVLDYDGNATSDPSYSDQFGESELYALNAGTYVLQVIIDNQNNQGSIYVVVEVSRANSSSGSNMVVMYPTLDSQYAVYNLDGTIVETTSDSTVGNLEYGQTIADIQDDIMLTTNAIATYTDKYGIAQQLDGMFYLQDEESYQDENGITFDNPNYFDVNYNDYGTVIYYTIKIYWMTGSYVNGEFVQDTNFNIVYSTVYIYVARATADFSDLELEELTYGDTIADLTEIDLKGFSTEGGWVASNVVYTYGTDTAMDALLLGATDYNGKSLNFTASMFTGKTVILGLDSSGAIMYVLYYQGDASDVYNVGDNNSLKYKFVTAGDFSYYYRDISTVSLNLVVNKKTVEVVFNTDDDKDYIEYAYGSIYANETPTVTIINDGVTIILDVILTYYSGQNEITINSSTPVGTYTVKAEINAGNYEGSATITFEVVKGTVAVSGNINTSTIIYYGTYVNDIVLVNNGSLWVKNTENESLTFAGTYAFVIWDEDSKSYIEDTTKINAVGNITFTLMFTSLLASPDSSVVYEDCYETFYYEYTISVQQAIVAIEVDEDTLTQTYNGNATSISATGYMLDGETLVNFIIIYTDSNDVESSAATDAGRYSVEIVVSEDYYQGSLYTTLIINKAEATISDIEQVYTYDGLIKVFDPEITISIEKDKNLVLSYTVTYLDYLGNTVTDPTEVGKYTAIIAAEGDNYYASKIANLYIVPEAPSITALSGLTQTYSAIGNAGATATFEVDGVVYTMYYSIDGASDELVALYDDSVVGTNWTGVTAYPQLDSAELSAIIPANAGVYAVVIRVSYNGITADYVMDAEGNNYTMYINKAVTTIVIDENTIDGYIQEVYTGYGLSNISYSSSLAVDITIYSRLEGETEYSVGAPINAGYYEIKLEVSNSNYIGYVEGKMFVDKATPTILMTPAIKSTISYGTINLTEVEFYDGGQVVFDGKELDGTWYINETSEYLATLLVGTHIVNVAYLPADTDNFNVATILSADGVTEAYATLKIDKNDISEYITIDESQLSRTYTGYQIVVTGYIADNDVVAAGYGTISVIVYYNGTTSAVTNAGTYTISATVNDSNYTGTIDDIELVIGKANLTIVAPTLSSIGIGDSLSSDDIGSDGYAYIALTTGQTETTVSGTFSLVYPSTIYTSANYQTVLMRFTPNDTSNHNIALFETTVFVEGTPSTVTNIQTTSAETVYYGQPLSTFTITCDESISGVGTIEWVTPDAVLTAGSHYVSYIFTPENSDEYNIATGTVVVYIEKATLSYDINSVVATAYSGGSIYDATIAIDFWHIVLTDASITWLVSGLTCTISTTTTGVLAAGDSVYVTATYTSMYYETVEIGIYVKVLDEVDSSSFAIGKTSKEYDGEDIKAEDFSITVSGTDYTIDNDDLIFTIYQNGVEVDSMIECGTYTVVVSIKNYEVVDGKVTYIDSMLYGGSAEFTYTIEKLDISDAISVVNNVKDYGDYSTTITASTGYDVAINEFIFTYYSYDKSVSYGTTQPQNAGEYKVVVSIDQSNNYYSSSYTCDFIILQSELEIVISASYNYTYGSTIEIIPQVSSNISTSNYIITYTNTETNNTTTTVPQNAGVYTVKVTIIHSDYYGSAQSTLTISQTTVTLQSAPTISAITYGQTLSDSTITDGLVVYGTSAEEVKGTFSFVDTTTKYNAGTQTVELQFIPTNSTNFATLTGIYVSITINKAIASITMVESTSTLVYTGSA
ncbi:MAG: MBG domain-containing protein, partial [Bacillota bacterium]